MARTSTKRSSIAFLVQIRFPLSFVDLAVDVDVIDPVIVAVHVHGNDTVVVIGSPLKSGIDHLRQHGNDTFKQFDSAAVVLVVDQLLDSHHVQMRGALHRRASRDRVVLSLVGAGGLACSFCDVLRSRLRGPPKLIDEVGMASGKALKEPAGERQEFDRTLVDVELLEAEHDRVIDRRWRAVAQPPSTGGITTTVSFPCTCTATITGSITITSTSTITSTVRPQSGRPI